MKLRGTKGWKRDNAKRIRCTGRHRWCSLDPIKKASTKIKGERKNTSNFWMN